MGVTFYKGSEACFLVYDITNKESFEKIPRWQSEFLRLAGNKSPDTFPFVLLGNKCDRQNDRRVSKEEADKWAKEANMPHYETSAKDLIGIEEPFAKAIEMALKNQAGMM